MPPFYANQYVMNVAMQLAKFQQYNNMNMPNQMMNSNLGMMNPNSTPNPMHGMNQHMNQGSSKKNTKGMNKSNPNYNKGQNIVLENTSFEELTGT